jgi:hypothetical protein
MNTIQLTNGNFLTCVITIYFEYDCFNRIYLRCIQDTGNDYKLYPEEIVSIFA